MSDAATKGGMVAIGEEEEELVAVDSTTCTAAAAAVSTTTTTALFMGIFTNRTASSEDEEEDVRVQRKRNDDEEEGRGVDDDGDDHPSAPSAVEVSEQQGWREEEEDDDAATMAVVVEEELVGAIPTLHDVNDDNGGTATTEERRRPDSPYPTFIPTTHHNAFLSSSTDAAGRNAVPAEPPEEGPPVPFGAGEGRVTRCVRTSCRILCVPVVVLFTAIALTSVVTFCILPGLILVAASLCVYYCCAEDPIPFRVLLSAMLLDDENNGNGGDPNRAGAVGIPPKLRRAEIANALERRALLRIAEVGPREGNDADGHDVAPAAVVAGPLEKKVPAGDGTVLVFSEPLPDVHDDEDDSNYDDDGDANQPIRGDDNPDSSSSSISGSSDDVAVMGIELTTLSSSTEGPVGSEQRQRDPVAAGTDAENFLDDPDDVVMDIETGGAAMMVVSSKGGATGENGVHHHEDDLINDGNITNDADERGSPDDSPGAAATAQLSSDQDDNDDDHQHQERGVTCDICLHSYRVGDVVAWSHNPRCSHGYHVDCITDWLVQCSHHRRSCPSCRGDFVYPRKKKKKNRRKEPSSPSQQQQQLQGGSAIVAAEATL
jgi:hypothetical protein